MPAGSFLLYFKEGGEVGSRPHGSGASRGCLGARTGSPQALLYALWKAAWICGVIRAAGLPAKLTSAQQNRAPGV